MSQRVLVFPAGTSSGNTYQLIRCALSSDFFTSAVILQTGATKDPSERIVNFVKEQHPDFLISTLPVTDFQNSLPTMFAGDTKFHFVVGPSTTENQLLVFSGLISFTNPTFWIIHEKHETGGLNDRSLRCFSHKQSFLLEWVSEEEILPILSKKVQNLVRKNNVQWDGKTARFSYEIKFPKKLLHRGKVSQRKWEQKQYILIHELRKALGIHGLIVTHAPIPQAWQASGSVERRFAAREIRRKQS